MNKNLKRVIAIVLIVVTLMSCVACGSSDKPQTFNVGYSKAEQSVENRMSRVIDDYVVDNFGVEQTYTVKDFKERLRDGEFYGYYEFKIVLKHRLQTTEIKTYEMVFVIDNICKNLEIIDVKQLD